MNKIFKTMIVDCSQVNRNETDKDINNKDSNYEIMTDRYDFMMNLPVSNQMKVYYNVIKNVE